MDAESFGTCDGVEDSWVWERQTEQASRCEAHAVEHGYSSLGLNEPDEYTVMGKSFSTKLSD